MQLQSENTDLKTQLAYNIQRAQTEKSESSSRIARLETETLVLRKHAESLHSSSVAAEQALASVQRQSSAEVCPLFFVDCGMFLS